MRSVETDVVIVGASTVGALSTLLLAQQGVRTVTCEARAGLSAHPRAMGVGPRTVEILRQAGIADDVDRRSVDMSGGNLQSFSTPTLAEADLVRLSAEATPRTDGFAGFTPQTLRGTCPQSRIDDVALSRARALGADVRHGCTVDDVADDDGGVTVLAHDADGPLHIRARYAVAADGARSGVRRRLGIEVEGPGAMGDPLISVLFRADLEPWTKGLPFVVCTITDEQAAGGLLPVDGDRLWLYVVRCTPESGLRPETFDAATAASLIVRAVGAGPLSLEVRDILGWQVRAQLAERFRAGRVLLAGDAAHVVPPVGAFGMNTGIADAHNLAWKLSHVLSGRAGEGLLDSYEQERRPVAETVLAQAMLRLDDPSLHWAEGESGARLRAAAGALNAPVVHLGYRYDSAAVAGGGVELRSTEELAPNLDGSPGSRLPHDWLDGGAARSTLDLVEHRFTLLVADTGAASSQSLAAEFAAAAAELDLPLAVHRCPHDLRALAGTDAVLVRPDQVVAWRAGPATAAGGAGVDATAVLRDLLARTPAR